MNLSASSTTAGERRFILLAPPSYADTRAFRNLSCDAYEYKRLLADAQRLRGRVYLADGAISAEDLTHDGRHRQVADYRSLHLLSVNGAGQVLGCTRYYPHANTTRFAELAVARTPLANDYTWRPPLRRAVERELGRARDLGYGYVEVGGWAVAEELRCSTEAVRMVVTIYALGRLLGGALGISTVTTRHASSSILRRLGGLPLVDGGQEIASYYDPTYKCEMEILRFDSDRPSDHYSSAVARCQNALAKAEVIVNEQLTSELRELDNLATIGAEVEWDSGRPVLVH